MSSTVEPPVAVVTGAAGRFGSAVVARLEHEGFRVAGIDLRPSAAALPLIADVADPAAVRDAIRRVDEELGPASVLVTAAAMRDAAPFGTLDDARWHRLLAVNLGGTGNACAAILPGMLATGSGTVVTRSSGGALDGLAGDAYTAAATGAVLAFTRSLAVEVAPGGVRVNCVAGGRPESFADTVAFLVRDGGFYVGQVFSPAGEG